MPRKIVDPIAMFIAPDGPLAENPRRVGKPLDGKYAEMHSARVGAYRVLYVVDDTVLVVLVTKIGHRAEVYG